MRLGTIARIWRYPVKSMGGEDLTKASLTWRGIPGDRGWAPYDETRGGISGAKRLPMLRHCSARYLSEPVSGAAPPRAEVTFPDGTSAGSDSSEAARALALLCGRPVVLHGLGPAGTDTAPRIAFQSESPERQRELMGLLPDEPLPDFSEFPPERLLVLRQGNFFDALPLHLLTHTTLRTLARIAPESDWQERRFRANLIIDSDESDGYPEMSWLKRRVRVGGAVIDVAAGCPRCVLVTQAVDELPSDHRIMRTLVRETRHIAGVYASVVEEGEVRVGDAVEFVG